MSDAAKKILIGYVPLLLLDHLTPGDYIKPEVVVNHVDGGPKVLIHGVAWVQSPIDVDAVVPIFIIDRSREVVSHLEAWSEKDYSRFTLRANQYDQGYSISLIPDSQKSIERWKLARLVHHEDMVVDDDFIVYYQHLGVYCGGARLRELGDKITNPTQVGFIDKAGAEALAEGECNVDFLGPFKFIIGDDQHLSTLRP